jgi:hypothetical protein
MVKKVIKDIASILIFALGLVILLYSIYSIPVVRNKYPWLANQIQAYKYEQLAKKYPAGDYAAKRYRAMAESARQGSHDYKFEAGPLPIGAAK